MDREEIKKIMNDAEFPKGLKLGQSLMVWWWITFSHTRFVYFLERLKIGQYILFAYRDAKNHNK